MPNQVIPGQGTGLQTAAAESENVGGLFKHGLLVKYKKLSYHISSLLFYKMF